MYGSSWTTGGTVAGGGTLAFTGGPVLGWAILLGLALVVTGFVLLRNTRLKAGKRAGRGTHY